MLGRSASAALAAIPEGVERIGCEGVKRLAPVAGAVERRLTQMRYQSPLRYPGAKAGLTPVISRMVRELTRLQGRPRLFVEPFCGGAATALRLAGTDAVERILLADADPLVARFWQVAAAETEWLVDRMHEEPISLERWDYWRAWTPARPDDREIAVKCLFLNRTTFSGILHGRAGPIGGRTQASGYRIDCRFNKDALTERLRFVGALYTTNRLVDVWCKDWADTLGDVTKTFPEIAPSEVVVYLDPPYVGKSEKLYGRSFDPAGGYRALPQAANDGWGADGGEHQRLARYLRRQSPYRWVLSYDNVPDLTLNAGLYPPEETSLGTDTRDACGSGHAITKGLVTLRYSASGSAGRGGREELLMSTFPQECLTCDPAITVLGVDRSRDNHGPDLEGASG